MNTVLSTLVGKPVENPRTVIKHGFRGKSSDTAGCLIQAYSVFSICNGTILSVDRSAKTNLWCVTVNAGVNCWVRYAGLSSTGVLSGQTIKKGDFVGYGNNGCMQLEYCTAEPSHYPVRLSGIQLYKHDPTPIIFSKIDILGA